MKKSVLMVPVVLFAMSSFSMASEPMDVPESQVGQGMYCNVEKAEVCVVAKTEEDCNKLGGEKVDSCPSSENK